MPQMNCHFTAPPRLHIEGGTACGDIEADDADIIRAESGLPPHDGLEDLRVSTANAVTAILVHCEAIKRKTGAAELDAADISSSLSHIAKSARRIWNEMERNCRVHP